MKKFSRIAAIVLGCLTVVTGLLTLVGILLLPAEIAPPEQSVHENIYGIGYTDYPASKGLLLTFEDSSGVFIYLDFSSLLTHTYIFEENAEENAKKLPFFKDYTINADSDFLYSLCDRLGGIEIADSKGETTLFFSPALREFVEEGLNDEKRLQICVSFFDKFAKSGLSSEDFMFIIEDTQGNLSYSVCYDWIPHIKEMFCNYVFA